MIFCDCFWSLLIRGTVGEMEASNTEQLLEMQSPKESFYSHLLCGAAAGTVLSPFVEQSKRSADLTTSISS